MIDFRYYYTFIICAISAPSWKHQESMSKKTKTNVKNCGKVQKFESFHIFMLHRHQFNGSIAFNFQ